MFPDTLTAGNVRAPASSSSGSRKAATVSASASAPSAAAAAASIETIPDELYFTSPQQLLQVKSVICHFAVFREGQCIPHPASTVLDVTSFSAVRVSFALLAEMFKKPNSYGCIYGKGSSSGRAPHA
jgi:hypothetical protein